MMLFLRVLTFRSKVREPNDSIDGCVKSPKFIFPQVVGALLSVEIMVVAGVHKATRDIALNLECMYV